jgi:glycosyltransferase involved in cell wall biosynthesis
MKNILIIVQHLCRGGAEMSAAKLSVDLSESLENKVFILTFFTEEVYPTTFKYKGTLISMNHIKKQGIIYSVVNFINRVYFIKRIKKKYMIDYSISYLSNADFVNILSSLNEKVIISVRSSSGHNSGNLIKNKIVSWLYNKADIIVIQNKRIGTKFKEELKITSPRYVVIPNYFDFEKIIEKSYEDLTVFENRDNYFVLGQIARLYYPKGQWHLLRIFNGLRKKRHDLRLIILGEGNMKDILLAYAKNLGLRTIATIEPQGDKINLSEYDVCFLGFQSNPFKFLTVFDVFMFTSLYEGFPNALAEAMICGKCVISTNCETGPLELISPEAVSIFSYPHETQYGFLMPPFSGKIESYAEPLTKEEQLWIDTILSIEADKRKQLGLSAQDRMKEFDKGNIVCLWQNILT